MKKIQITTKDGDILRGISWEIDSPIANVVIMQGMEEYGQRYDGLAKFLNSKSINAYCIDCFGQGENVSRDLSNRGIWPEDGYFKQVEAYDIMVQEAKKNGAKTYIFAHSMGSYMAQSYMEMFSGNVEKVVLCGAGAYNPAVGIGLLVAKMKVTKANRDKKAGFLAKLMFGSFNKKIKQQRTPYDWLSFNEKNVDQYIADPLCGFGATNGFCLEFLKGMHELYKKSNVRKIDKNQQIFIISGMQDPVTNYTKSVSDLTVMYADNGVNNVKSKIYADSRHEILFEKCNTEVYKDVLEFFLM